MTTINTVLGPIDSEDLGFTLMHEHVMIGASGLYIFIRQEGTVEDCAKVVEFLATDLSDYVTGKTITIDGGYCDQR